MSGVAVIRSLLATNAAVLAVVPADRIKAGDLPIDTPLPAISVMHVSGVPRLTLAMTEAGTLHSDRVQVSVVGKGYAGNTAGSGYPDLRALLKLALAACPNRRGTVNGVAVDSILPDVEGPDFEDPETSLHQGSRDFIVRFTL